MGEQGPNATGMVTRKVGHRVDFSADLVTPLLVEKRPLGVTGPL